MAQVNPTVGDLDGNAALIADTFARARDAGADLVVFPELALTGYPPEDLLHKPAFIESNLTHLRALAKVLTGAVSVVGFVDRTASGALHNAAAVLAGGRRRGTYRKALLPNYGVFDERRYFAPGDEHPLFTVRGVRVGITICEDAWDGDGPVRTTARNGAEVVININASPYHMGKSLERQILFRQRARDEHVFFLYCQTVGGQDELVFDGDSLVYDPSGRLIARGSQFEQDLIIVDLTLPGRARAARAKARVVAISGVPARAPARAALAPRAPRLVTSPAEEVYDALLLGTRDYMRKNGFERAFIALSGGMDSSLTAVVAADAIGADKVTGVAMPGPYSSTASVEDAKELATNLGIDLQVIPIDDILASFTDALAEPFARTPTGTAEENLQARIRGTILMALSNKFPPSLVLTTGNKSELAVGYSTLYGDMAGGFAVIKDVPKTLVYELASWRNAYGLAAIPDRVFTKPPSAELRPGQLDTDALPPYDELDPILQAYVEGGLSIGQMIASGFDEPTVRRIVDMIDRSEYKRRQSPPGVKITHRAFGRDWRLPITNRFRHPEKGAQQ
jgi:NAD+ synthase (glutamine-hydrolysing)